VTAISGSITSGQTISGRDFAETFFWDTNSVNAKNGANITCKINKVS
jgi:hypothetical protein